MSEIVAYKAKNIDGLLEYVDARQERVEKFNNDCKAYRETIDNRSLHGFKSFMGGWVIQGYVKEKFREDLPVGWRNDKSRGSWEVVPAKRTDEGKQHAKDLAKLNLPDVKYPGFPDMLHSKSHGVFPRLRKYADDSYFMVLSMEADDSGVDQALWEKISLATFYTETENKTYEEK